jgi:hypothetical protein
MTGKKTANGVDVTYTYTYGCENTFTIKLTGGSDKAPGAVTSNECTYTASWASLNSKTVPGSHYLGADAASGAVSIFSIVVFVIVFGAFPMYIGVGIAVKVKGQGEALDIEAVPQIEFWRSLPGLVKDGFVFTYTYVSTPILMLPIHHARAAAHRGRWRCGRRQQRLRDRSMSDRTRSSQPVLRRRPRRRRRRKREAPQRAHPMRRHPPRPRPRSRRRPPRGRRRSDRSARARRRSPSRPRKSLCSKRYVRAGKLRCTQMAALRTLSSVPCMLLQGADYGGAKE